MALDLFPLELIQWIPSSSVGRGRKWRSCSDALRADRAALPPHQFLLPVSATATRTCHVHEMLPRTAPTRCFSAVMLFAPPIGLLFIFSVVYPFVACSTSSYFLAYFIELSIKNRVSSPISHPENSCMFETGPVRITVDPVKRRRGAAS